MSASRRHADGAIGAGQWLGRQIADRGPAYEAGLRSVSIGPPVVCLWVEPGTGGDVLALARRRYPTVAFEVIEGRVIGKTTTG